MSCKVCGMHVEGNARYRPYAACLMFKGCQNGNTVDANLRAVFEYGMEAQAAGVSLDEAMTSIAWIAREGEKG